MFAHSFSKRSVRMNKDNRIDVDLTLLATMILVALRADGIIKWPWILVISPILGGYLIKLILILVIVVRGRKK